MNRHKVDYATADEAINRSINYTEIVTLPYDIEIASDLAVACDDSTEANDGLIEYWGTTDDGYEWRIHMGAPH